MSLPCLVELHTEDWDVPVIGLNGNAGGCLAALEVVHEQLPCLCGHSKHCGADWGPARTVQVSFSCLNLKQGHSLQHHKLLSHRVLVLGSNWIQKALYLESLVFGAGIVMKDEKIRF
jgi:hypothetical protein